MFDLEQGRLSRMIPPPAKHKPQPEQAPNAAAELHKPATAGTSHRRQRQGTVNEGSCLGPELLHFQTPQILNTDSRHVFQTAFSAVNVTGHTQTRQFLGFS